MMDKADTSSYKVIEYSLVPNYNMLNVIELQQFEQRCHQSWGTFDISKNTNLFS